MLVLRGTKKLRDRIKGATAHADDVSSTVLGDWFATALFWKPQVALLVNQRTLLPVLMPLAPAAKLPERIPEAIASALRLHGASDQFIAGELAAMHDVRISPTNDRSVLGVMNEFAFLGGLHFSDGVTDLDELSHRLSSLILGPLDKRHGSPDRELAALLHGGHSNVIEFPGTAAPPPALRSGNQANLYQLKVTLIGIKPAVWRRLVVSASTPLDRLHEYIQAAFGWWNYHLYEFEIDRKRYGIPDDEWDDGPRVRNAHRSTLGKLVAVGESFRYSYDFGDGWEHKVVVEQSVPFAPGTTVPMCTGGRRACPPEDCGGPWGYQELLAILSDPAHREHQERVSWVGEWGGGRLDPEAFDPAAFADNLDLLRLAALD